MGNPDDDLTTAYLVGYHKRDAQIERLLAELDEAREQTLDVWHMVDTLLPPNPTFYMDPPDGGNVDQIEIVRRYIEELKSQRDAHHSALEACAESHEDLYKRIPDPDDLSLTLRYAEALLARSPYREPFNSDSEAVKRVRATLPEDEHEG